MVEFYKLALASKHTEEPLPAFDLSEKLQGLFFARLACSMRQVLAKVVETKKWLWLWTLEA